MSDSKFEELKEKILQYNPDSDLEFIEKGYLYAKKAHEGQYRHSGEEYIIHPFAVAMILTTIQADDSTIVAGFLHDVIEDTGISLEEISKDFSPTVALLTDGVTKLGKLEGRTKTEQKADNIRKMFIAMAMDIRVIIIKLADRLHNMRTLHHHSSQKKMKEIARETLEIYTPLAHRLGIFQFKWELEDLCLRVLEPEKYFKLVDEIAESRDKRMKYINEVIKVLSEKLTAAAVKAEIIGRPKNMYSIYKKMQTQHKELSEIYDLLAVRVIVDDISGCYGSLGIVHSLWVPIPGRFKDYIAMPKQNMYQSIHTTVISPNGEPLEIQIRTHEMHEIAEHGIAAHWQYKSGIATPNKESDNKLKWLRQMLDWQTDVKDADEFMDEIKNDLTDESVYVFTPKGDVYELASNAVPLDFAYRVHTEVGHRCAGARINGRIVTFDYKLQNGDIVEIITNKNTTPSLGWLNIVKTPQAKNRIRQWFRKEKRDESIAKGKELLQKELKKYNDDPSSIIKNDMLLDIANSLNYVSLDSLYVAIGEGHLAIGSVINKIKEEVKLELPECTPEIKPFKERQPSNTEIIVKGIDNILVKLAHCCNPLPGDDITGYVTMGKGITVHRKDCGIINGGDIDRNRLIEVAWGDKVRSHYQVEIEVSANDRPKLTTDIMTAISDTKTTINSIYGRSAKHNTAYFNVKIEVKNKEHLEYIMHKIKRIKDVTDVVRVINGRLSNDDEDDKE